MNYLGGPLSSCPKMLKNIIPVTKGHASIQAGVGKLILIKQGLEDVEEGGELGNHHNLVLWFVSCNPHDLFQHCIDFAAGHGHLDVLHVRKSVLPNLTVLLMSSLKQLVLGHRSSPAQRTTCWHHRVKHSFNAGFAEDMSARCDDRRLEVVLDLSLWNIINLILEVMLIMMWMIDTPKIVIIITRQTLQSSETPSLIIC